MVLECGYYEEDGYKFCINFGVNMFLFFYIKGLVNFMKDFLIVWNDVVFYVFINSIWKF